MARYRIHRAGKDVVITKTEGEQVEQVRFPEELFWEILHEVKTVDDAIGYPVEIETSASKVELPYADFLALEAHLKAN